MKSLCRDYDRRKSFGYRSNVISYRLVSGIMILLSSFLAQAQSAGEVVGNCINGTGIMAMVILGGAVIWTLIRLLGPKERITCEKCGSQNAIATYKSAWNGKTVPNHCPGCNHQWL